LWQLRVLHLPVERLFRHGCPASLFQSHADHDSELQL
jgi:hypothetical protein